MVKAFVRAISFAAALALAVPSLALGQDPKTTGGSSSTTTTGSVKPTSSSGGDGGGLSGGKAGGISQPPSLPPPSSSSSSSMGGSDLGSYSSRSIRGGSVSTSAKSESVQKAPAPAGVSVIEGQANLSSSSVLSRTRLGATGGRGVVDSGGGRDRGNNPLQGYATPRTGDHNNLVSFPFYGPWGSWYPWVAGGFGWYANYYGYNPWYYGATCWSWNAWGPWFDPYGYCWDPYPFSGYSVPMYVEGTDEEGALRPAVTTGTLRIKANVPNAKVYVDSAFAGTVEEFNGLNDRLEIEGGKHVIELRAEGYRSASKEIEVKIGKTTTVRLSLKKN